MTPPPWLVELAAKALAPVVVRVLELLEERSRVVAPPAPTRDAIRAAHDAELERRRRAEAEASDALYGAGGLHGEVP